MLNEKMIKEIIYKCNQIIKISSYLFDMKMPYIYYFTYKPFILYDDLFNIVSYDKKDMPYSIESVCYIPKEHTLYIHIGKFNDEISILTRVCQESRRMYQIHEIMNYQKNKLCQEEDYLIKQWMFCYFRKKRELKDYEKNSPIVYDMAAYSSVLMWSLYEVKLKYPSLDEEMFEDKRK